VLGAGVVVVGLALFVLVGDPNAGVDDAPAWGLLTAAAVITAIVAVLLLWQRRTASASVRAAVLGLSAGLFFGVSATFAKPVINDLHVSIADTAADWRTWALLGFGFVAILLQQLSLATGQLAPAMAALYVSNPALSVILGILLFEERLTRPAWHVVVAAVALLAALAGATLITLANRETRLPDVATEPDSGRTNRTLA
jgi:EamA domain-containing membrane protein RarD